MFAVAFEDKPLIVFNLQWHASYRSNCIATKVRAWRKHVAVKVPPRRHPASAGLLICREQSISTAAEAPEPSIPQFCAVLYGFVQFCTILYNFVRCYTILYGFVQFCTVLYNFVRFRTLLYGFVQFCMISYNSVRFCTTLYGFVQFCTACCAPECSVVLLRQGMTCKPGLEEIQRTLSIFVAALAVVERTDSVWLGFGLAS